MKLKLMVSDEKYNKIASELMAKGFEINDDAELILTERDFYAKHLIGRRGDEIFRLDTDKISYIESFGHDVVAHSGGEEYRINERLRRLEDILDPKRFLRVSNSVIVAVTEIKSVRPALSQKFTLTMSDGSKVDVTRTYYYIFKEHFGI